jgi:hypothetical protein
MRTLSARATPDLSAPEFVLADRGDAPVHSNA